MRATRTTRLALAAVGCLATSCGGATSETGIQADLRLSGAGVQYVPAPLLDEPGALGPAVHSVSASGHVSPGATGRSIGGAVAEGSAAVLIGIDGDVGHFVVPVTSQDLDNPPDLNFSVQAAFAQTLGLGPHFLRVRAVSVDGTRGPSALQGFSVDASPVTGVLTISLAWDTEADLDLHVVAPPSADGKTIELWSGNRSTLLPRSALEGGPYTDEELATAGVLDFDSNSQCVIDGRLSENAVWTVPPTPGHYLVRVDAFSMCGQPAAHWRLSGVLGDTSLGTYAGVFTDSDTRYAHGAGAGLSVFEFDVL